MEQKELIGKLIKASNEIYKNRTPSANYIHLSEEYIQQQADERKISFLWGGRLKFEYLYID